MELLLSSRPRDVDLGVTLRRMRTAE